MSASVAGSGPGSVFDLTNRSRAGGVNPTARAGSHSMPGTRSSVIATFRGPVRRSIVADNVRRQDPAMVARSASVLETCISFSASAKVAADTSGPVPDEVPNATGAPGVAGGATVPAAPCSVPPASRGDRDDAEWRGDKELTSVFIRRAGLSH